MRFQIAFRETRDTMADHRLWIAVGLVEMDLTLAARSAEKFTGVRMEFTQDGAPLCALFTNNVYAPTYEGRPIDEDLKASGVEAQLAKQLDRVVPGPFSNAELFMRRTRGEAAEGSVVMAFSGFVGYKPPIDIDCDGVFQLASDAPESFLRYEGRIGGDIRPEWGNPGIIEATRGRSVSSFLRLPVWGFGAEAVRIGSTMHLDVQDMSNRHRALHFADRSPSEEAEYTRLSAFMKREGLNDFGRHPDFEEALRRLMEAGYPTEDGTPLTRSQLSERSEHMAVITRELVARQRMADMSAMAASVRR
ncbi:hypothetical protein OIU34_22120 [Pararhizobium sp. BT-229]|uniref:hypothetical protein n=1 Tax=Pararhizobium sp. BT-229 TaxID=2986923 RepID=UPI0021F6F415|nr:hypothetical protein [Pararhizobium sp. BT-229]MCV9964590.1 hypothetical protein [Pararhizobium sp. BT-229]